MSPEDGLHFVFIELEAVIYGLDFVYVLSAALVMAVASDNMGEKRESKIRACISLNRPGV